LKQLALVRYHRVTANTVLEVGLVYCQHDIHSLVYPFLLSFKTIHATTENQNKQVQRLKMVIFVLTNNQQNIEAM